jgi:hypothetical protein
MIGGEKFVCLNCHAVNGLNRHARCYTCDSDSVISLHAQQLSGEDRTRSALVLLWNARRYLARVDNEFDPRAMDAGDIAAWWILYDLSDWIITERRPATLVFRFEPRSLPAVRHRALIDARPRGVNQW